MDNEQIGAGIAKIGDGLGAVIDGVADIVDATGAPKLTGAVLGVVRASLTASTRVAASSVASGKPDMAVLLTESAGIFNAVTALVEATKRPPRQPRTAKVP